MYLNLTISNGAVFAPAEVTAAVDQSFPRKLNFEEAFRVLEEDCRPLGLQPQVYLDAVQIVEASKKFLNRERRYNQPLSKRAQEYISFCNNR